MRKSQISSQVFVYIMAAVIAGVILVVGYKAISQVMNVSRQASFDTFKTDFESEIQTYSRQYGSQKRFEFSLSSSYDRICFIDSMENSRFQINNDIIDNALIKDSVENEVKQNIFLLKGKNIAESFYVDSLDVRGDYLCLKNEGKMEVWLKGTGKKAELYTK